MIAKIKKKRKYTYIYVCRNKNEDVKNECKIFLHSMIRMTRLQVGGNNFESEIILQRCALIKEEKEGIATILGGGKKK